MKTNPNDPAFQSFERFEKEIEGSETKIDVLIPTGGLTKRELFAIKALQGLLATQPVGYLVPNCNWAVEYADELIYKLNEGVDKKEGTDGRT